MKTLIIRSSEWLRASAELWPVIDPIPYLHQQHISQSSWEKERRGYRPSLCNSITHRKCCLGINASACGITDGEMMGLGMPSSIFVEVLDRVAACYPWVQKRDAVAHAQARYSDITTVQALYENTIGASVAAEINDDFSTMDEEKIARLRPVFQRAGWAIDWRPEE